MRRDEVKKIIEDTASYLIFPVEDSGMVTEHTYFGDKYILLPEYWQNLENFKDFISRIDRNLLFIEDIEAVCREVNRQEREYCDISRCEEMNCRTHPFSVLMQLGLLGKAYFKTNIAADDIQDFTHARKVTYIKNEHQIFPDKDTIYLLHPALTKCISKHLRNGAIMHSKRFIIGKGLSIPKHIFRELLEDRRKMHDGEISKEQFEDKYYSL